MLFWALMITCVQLWMVCHFERDMEKMMFTAGWLVQAKVGVQFMTISCPTPQRPTQMLLDPLSSVTSLFCHTTFGTNLHTP